MVVVLWSRKGAPTMPSAQRAAMPPRGGLAATRNCRREAPVGHCPRSNGTSNAPKGRILYSPEHSRNGKSPKIHFLFGLLLNAVRAKKWNFRSGYVNIW